MIVVGILAALSLGGVIFVFSGVGAEKTQKRLAAVTKSQVRAVQGTDANQQRRKNVQSMLKQLEQKQAEQKKRPTIRRRLEMAGLQMTVRQYWIMCGSIAAVTLLIGLIFRQSMMISLLGAFSLGLGMPRWALGFLKARREKAFTREFATAIDIVVRSVRTGLPVNEAMKVVASEVADPVGSEFKLLCEGQKVGIALDQGLARMYERMPTPEVSFFGIVLTIQQKSGGNLSEALSNLSEVLRDRKRLEGKIRAMSSEAKASAMIIGSLPPGVAIMLYLSSPDYIAVLFHEQLGQLMLMGCAVWMSLGVLVMKKMVSFKV
jgi:tight adherence protein B